MLKRFAQFNQWLLPYTMYVLIFVTVLLPKIPVIDIPNTYVKVRSEDFMNAIIVAIWFFGFTWYKKSFLKSTLNQTILLYWFVGFVSLISGIFITQVAPTNLAILSWLRRIEYMIFFFVGFSATKDVKVAYKYTSALFIAAVLAVIYGIGQIHLKWCSISTTNREFAKGECGILTSGARPNSTFGGHYDLAIFMGYVIPLAAGVFFAVKKQWQRLACIGVFLATFYMMTVTQSRTAFVAALLTLAALLWFYGKKLWLIGLATLALIVIMVAGQSLITRYTTTLKLIMNPVQQKVTLTKPIDQIILETTTAGGARVSTSSAVPGQEDLPDEAAYRQLHPVQFGVVDPALEARLSNGIRFQNEWPRALRAFYRNPLLGSGYASLGTLFATEYGFATDNDYLRMLGETGILGTLSFMLIFVAFFRIMYRFLHTRNIPLLSRGLVIGFAAATVGFFANALFIDVFESSKLAIIFWLFLGIIAAVMQNALKQPNEKVG